MSKDGGDRVACVNPYAQAAALWVANAYDLDAALISDVTFAVIHTGYCETCAGEETGITFKYNGKSDEREFEYGMTAGRFIEECVALLGEEA